MKPVPAIAFENVTFAYLDPDAPEDASARTREDLNIVFEDFSLEIPAGVTSVLGENGIGKSTLLLLGGARFQPVAGRVSILGRDASGFAAAPDDPAVEEERNRLVSFVFQNMEFETEESLGELIDWLLSQAEPARRPDRASLVAALELEACLGRRPQQLSKGELQRAVIALAVCYGSRLLIMDEPVFALEERHKQAAFAWLRDWCRSSGTSLVYTAHDIHLCRDFADTMLLLFKDKSYRLGPVAEVCTDELLEAAYRVPLDTLYQKESLYRDMLLGSDRKA